MGIKRPFVEEEYPEPSFTRPKVVEYCLKSPSIEEQSHITAAQTTDTSEASLKLMLNHILGESKSSICEGQHDRSCVDGMVFSLASEKTLNGNASSFSETDSDEAVENDGSPVWSTHLHHHHHHHHHPPGYVELSVPKRSPEPYIDPYAMLFSFPPRKEVLIGPQHQAEVPPWDPNFSSDMDREDTLMGTNIFPLPGLNDPAVDVVRRTDCCSCPNRGSMRCVQQHVKEAREKLLNSVGNEKFSQLGFLDMGEEVASNWTPDEERIFHEVVFSNPKSHGRNFWSHLRDVFPHITMKELVSYYFNVFMLRRRAVQNRSFVLEIDSDDDDVEWGSSSSQHLGYGSESWEVDSELDDGDQVVENNGVRRVVVDGGDEEEEEDVGNWRAEWFDDHGNLHGDSSWVDDFWSPTENGKTQQQGAAFDDEKEQQNV